MFRLANIVQDYAWGSTTAIPELLGVPPTGRPAAELWMGAHPSAPSRAVTSGEPVPLDALLARDPAAALGADVVARFGPRLPYLLKVLAAEHPLSLQVHPTLAQAQAGYDAEEAAGVPRAAGHRTYSDRNHKPEMVLALTAFDALCGFRPPREVVELLAGLDTPLVGELGVLLRAHPPADAVPAAVRRLLDGDRRPTATEVAEVAAACRARLTKGSPYPGADRTVVRLAEAYPGDPGVVMSLLLNQLTLQPGQAMYVPAGAVHAYQHGVGVEIMASSDNVLRAGLTAKHVNIPELLATIAYVAGPPTIVAPERLTETTLAFPVPVDDFVLSVTEVPDDTARAVPGRGPRILLCLEGTATVSARETVTLRRGESAFVSAADGPLAVAGPCRVVQADVP